MHRPLRFLWLLSILGAALPFGRATSAPLLRIDAATFELVASARVARTVFDYTYRAKVTNAGSPAADVVAALASTSPYTSVIDGELRFGAVPAGATVASADTFTVRHDRAVPFDAAALGFTFSFSAANAQPVASAGPDQTVLRGTIVTLDGTGSSDSDGDALAYSWSFVAVPPGSAATLSDPAAVAPTFVADKSGAFELRLTVLDGRGGSAADTVRITTLPSNTAPVANAGADAQVFVGDAVRVDGTASSDVDGDALAFLWELVAAPSGSTAALDDPTTVQPTLTPDLLGDYRLRLTVSDGRGGSAVDEVTISTLLRNRAPTAVAGPDQAIEAGRTVLLDGGASFDPDGDALSYVWSLIARPPGSAAVLANAGARDASFFADSPGDFVVQLVVNDGALDSAPDTVLVTTSNARPVADAGENQTAQVGDTVQLDGTASSDANGDVLHFAWSFTARPAGSTAELSDAAAARPAFVADRPGLFVAQLIVGDGLLDSAPDTTTVTVEVRPPDDGRSPTITNIDAPAVVLLDEQASLQFDYADPDGDIAAIELVQVGAPERTVRLPAPAAGLMPGGGHAQLDLRADDLSFGVPTTFELRLLDSRGGASGAASFTITAAGRGGGTRPAITGFAASAAAWTRPAGAYDTVRPRLAFDWADPDADLARVRVTVTGPPGVAQTGDVPARLLDIAGTGGSVSFRLLSFRAGSTLGAYTIALAPIDRAGNVGPEVAVALELVAAGGAAPLAIASFAPTQGAPGTDVTIAGSGFLAAPGANRVELGGVPVEVTTATPTALTVAIPEGAPARAPFVIHTAGGTTASAGFFAVPAALGIAPAESDVPVGHGLTFAPRVTAASDPTITWLVNGVPGGAPSTGTITAEGRYMAPAAVPSGGVVTVEARLTAEPAVRATAAVRVTPPPAYPGLGQVLAASGGQVLSADGGAAVTVPPGALAADSSIEVTSLRAAELPAAPAGFRAAGGARFGPDGLEFAAPVTVAVPLARYTPPGTQLPFRYLLDDGTLRDEGIVATVAPNGEQAVASIRHFSAGIVLESAPTVVEVAGPILTSLAPDVIQEGMRVPVLVTGSRLDSQLTVEALDASGAPAEELAIGPIYALGDRAGFTLSIDPIVSLPEGESRTFLLRFRRPGAAPVDRPFIVTGLDELIVEPRHTMTLSSPAPRRFSGIKVAGTLKLAAGELDLEATGPVIVAGKISTEGDDGLSATGWLCAGGTAGAEAQCGQGGPNDGRGGLGKERETLGETVTGSLEDLLKWGPFGVVGTLLGAGLELVIDDSEDPEHRGAHGVGCVSPDFAHEAEGCSHRFREPPLGVGGIPGNDLDLEEIREEAVGVVQSIVACIDAIVVDAPIGLLVCPDAGRSAVQFVDRTVDRTQMLTGRRGFGAGIDGQRGGGGGGGGRFRTIDFPASLVGLDIIGNFAIAIDGGGGGQGGGAARDVSIVTGADLLLIDNFAAAGVDVEFLRRVGVDLPDEADQGKIRASGGNGGAGSTDGRLTVATNNPVAKPLLDLVPWPTVPAFEGGGGGGGSGGFVALAAALTVHGNGSLDDHVLVDGGRGGANGDITIDPDTGVRLPHSLNPSVLANGARGSREVNSGRKGYVLREIGADGATVFGTGVTNRSVVRLEFRGGGVDPITIPVVAGDGRRADFEAEYDPAAQRHEVTLALFEGFNTIGPGHELMKPRVLSLFVDTDGDGLSDADEAYYRTDPNDGDTDGDGASDLVEILDGSNPLLADADRDGLPDGIEISLGTGTGAADSDGDGVRDGAEVVLHANPLDATDLPTGIPRGTLLAASQFGFLSVVDRASGLTGGLGRPAGGLGFGLAYDGAGRLLVASFSRLIAVEPLVADAQGDLAITEIGGFGEPGGVPLRTTQIAYDPVGGKLYGVELGPGPTFAETGQLVTIDPATGVAARVGVPGARRLHALAFDRTGRLFATTELDAATDLLVRLDPATGAPLAEIGPLGRPLVFGLAFDENDQLWATDVRSVRESDLLTVDAATGMGSIVVPIDRSLFGIAFAPAAQRAAQIVAGGSGSAGFTVARRRDGALLSWGDDTIGTLGDGGANVSRNVPGPIPAITNATYVASHAAHTLAARTDGTVWGFGYNGFGQLGDGGFASRSAPVRMNGVTGATAVAAGTLHSLVLRNDGTVLGVGYNFDGELGNGTTIDRTSPAPVAGLTNVVAIAAGGGHSLAIRADGTLWAWGRNGFGQLGDGTTVNRTLPQQVPGLSSIVAVAAGDDHTVALRADGTVFAFGRNANGQLGDGTVVDRSAPVALPDRRVAIAAGANHSLALRSDGSVFAWGRNNFGQLGNGGGADSTLPIAAAGLGPSCGAALPTASIAAGGDHSLVVCANGAVHAWGANQAGQLGDGTNVNRPTPVPVSGLNLK